MSLSIFTLAVGAATAALAAVPVTIHVAAVLGYTLRRHQVQGDLPEPPRAPYVAALLLATGVGVAVGSGAHIAVSLAQEVLLRL